MGKAWQMQISLLEEKNANYRDLEVMLHSERGFWKNGLCFICGIDEAGRGPLAGPVVAAAVIFPSTVAIVGIYDSKKLTPRQRELLYEEIRGTALSWATGAVSHEEIDRPNILKETF